MDCDEQKLLQQFILDTKEGKNIGDCADITSLIKRYRNFATYLRREVAEYEDKNKVYTYMLTFTIDPKRHDVEDSKLHEILEEYIVNFASKRHALRADLVREGDDIDHKHTHWHLGLELKKYIDFSNFLKYYRKTYGNVDISRSWSNDYDNVLKYINKKEPSTELANIKT